MKLHGQRWLYRLGNAEIVVENAFSWWGWAQERWLINDDIVREAGDWFKVRRVFDEPWLTPVSDGLLAVEMRSRFTGVDCWVTLDGEALEPHAVFEANWGGKRSWPASEDWKEVADSLIFNVLRQA
ncbi:MAG: hypothetical protein EDM03_08750 [Porphyrobacter sp. IPPAS B-1204]|nr:MAG: hypothetical protein EDM03_08750 [Porphyrobacter sp. IPPAS B-1204]